tara:strand:+ start:4134 stop:4322 length:189 start_codon:yes stop_codon:yes gene_type:complete
MIKKDKYLVTYGGSNEKKKKFNNIEQALIFITQDERCIDCKYRELYRINNNNVNSIELITGF